jgi:hypothetical protein
MTPDHPATDAKGAGERAKRPGVLSLVIKILRLPAPTGSGEPEIPRSVGPDG